MRPTTRSSDILLPLALLANLVPTAKAGTIDFARDVRPILSDRCFACHGPDAGARKGKPPLRLDLREGAIAPRDHGAAIVPGDAAASLLMARVRSADPSRRMPPPSKISALTDAEASILRQWIDEGATYPLHWAFVAPISTVPAPRPSHETRSSQDSPRSVKPIGPTDPTNPTDPIDPIDRFVFAELEAHGLQPTGEADRTTWIRRVTLDLTGLPPTPAEVDAFAGDASEDAHARVVDRLLATSAYAERMAGEWMDLARYADTYGYQSDVHRDVWPWRDWVIRAFQDNLPYDDFLTWQLAGDLLPESTRDQRLATAFQRLHRQTNEGGSVEEEMRVEYVADRVHTFGTAFLGLTMECARCHDHKFDPISQRDYYRLSAFFNRIDESGLYSHFTNAVPTPTLQLPDDAQAMRIEKAEAAVAIEERRLQGLVVGDARRAHDWAATGNPKWSGVLDAEGAYRLDLVEDGSFDNRIASDKPAKSGGENQILTVDGTRAVQLSGDDPLLFPGVGAFRRHDPFTIALRLRVPKIYERAVVLHRSRAWTDAGSRGYELLIEDGHLQAALIHFWPGNAVAIRTRAPIDTDRFVHVAVTWDGSSRADGLAIFVDGRRADTVVVRDRLTRTIVGGGEGDLTIGERFRDRGLAGGLVREVWVVRRALSGLEIRELDRPGSIESALSHRDQHPTELAGFYRAAIDPHLREQRERLRVARSERDAAKDAVFEIMTMEELPQPRPTNVLIRGLYNAPADLVTAGTPSSLPPLRPRADGAASVPDRLDLAHWLTADDHPLTARVAVNRYWQMLFGRGLVATADNFGNQGTSPSHPALLDHLAVSFRESGWDVKAMLRRLCLTDAYRRSSRCSEAARLQDPDNLWLARGPTARLSAEMLRDLSLAASGLLSTDVFGPSVKPYQPDGLWREKSGAQYTPDTGSKLYRRSLYTYWKRTSPPPTMMTFDAAERDVCVVSRQTTSSPLQALVLWNDPQFVEAARVLAEHVLSETGDVDDDDDDDDDDRIAEAFQRLAGRKPFAVEAGALRRLLATCRAGFEADPTSADLLLAVGEHPLSPRLDRVEVAAHTVVFSVIQSHDAVVWKR